jgi:hypothetical protein
VPAGWLMRSPMTYRLVPSTAGAATPKPGYAHYTLRQAAEDWLAHGLDGRSPKTVTKNQNVLEPIRAGRHGGRVLHCRSFHGHLALKRAIRHAEANDLVSRNVAALVDTPKGQEGRPSKSLTLD